MYFEETSAKSGANIERVFIDLAKLIYHKYKESLSRGGVEDETVSQSSKTSDISYMNRLQASGLRGYPGQ